MKSKTCTQNKQPSDKIQSSQFCQLGDKRTPFQNFKKKRNRLFDHSTTLIGQVNTEAYLDPNGHLSGQKHRRFQTTVYRQILITRNI